MISTNEFRTGLTVEWENGIWTIVDFQHVKPGKGSAFVRTRLKNIITGNVNETTFRAGEKLPKAQINYRNMQFMYESDGEYFVMDQESYEQMSFTKELLGDAIKYLKEDMVLGVQFYNGSPIGVELPNFVEL